MSVVITDRPVSVEATRAPLTEHVDPPNPQHPLWLSVLLHLFPGVVLATFVVLSTPVLEHWGVDPLFALLLGIGVVITPLELGYLCIYAKRTTGSWFPLGAVDYRSKLGIRRLLKLAALPAIWMVALVAISMTVADERLADSIFSWLPKALTDMATVDARGDSISGVAVVLLVMGFFLLNGIIGPITEELYFRGHLLPRIDRLGWVAPVLGTVFFAVYHFHTPWRYPAIFLGFLPAVWLAWRKRSLFVSLTAHLIINNLFILMMLAAFAGESA